MTFVEPFDPYLQWLGIPLHERPADHYRLLGLNRFESDAAVIARAADERMTLVRSYQTGRRGPESQRIMNELAAAKVCLLNPVAKENLDRTLRQQLAASIVAGFTPADAARTIAPQPPPIKPPPVPPPLPAPTVRFALDAADEEPAGPTAKPSPWWVPVISLVGLAMLILAATVAWGVLQDSLASRNSPSSIPPAPKEEVDSTQATAEKANPASTPIILFQEGSGEVNFSPAVAERLGGVELRTIGLDEMLVNWSEADNAARWHFRLVTPGFFKVEVMYATATEESGQLKLIVGDKTATCDLRSTGGPGRFITDTCTIAVPTSGQHSLVARAAGPEDDWLVLKSIRFIPVGGVTTPVIPPE